MGGVGALRHLEGELLGLERLGLLRRPLVGVDGCLVFCSNDYLGYGGEGWVGGGVSGAGASRLVSGEVGSHLCAEGLIASWLGVEASLLFSSGYAANVGVVSALAGVGDLVVSDVLNHASLIDGCRLSGARVVVVPHLDLGAVEAELGRGIGYRRRFVVTESYFSMDGDSPDLRGLRLCCDRWDAALLVDEAHAFGVFGPSGRGLCAEAGVVPDVLIGALGKAFGLQGAFVAGSFVLRSWLWNRARSFVFSTGMSPALADFVSLRVGRLLADEAGRVRLGVLSSRLREGLRRVVGDALLPSFGPILPVFVGDAEEAVGISAALRARGFLVQAIRPPTVPVGTSRLRITANAGLTEENIDAFLEALRSVWSTRKAGPQPAPSSAPTPSGTNQRCTRVVVIGTGTEIGKTHASVALVDALAKAGCSVVGLKPIESGVSAEHPEATDSFALAAVSTFHVKHPPPYVFAQAVSPHLAARQSGVSIDLGKVKDWVDAHDAEVSVIETAGAMLSPLSPTLTNLDLVRALKPHHILLVAPDRLGVLHDVKTTLHALRTLAPELPTPTVLLQPPSTPDTSTGTNAAELQTLHITTPHTFPRTPQPAAAAAALAAAMGLAQSPDKGSRP